MKDTETSLSCGFLIWTMGTAFQLLHDMTINENAREAQILDKDSTDRRNEIEAFSNSLIPLLHFLRYLDIKRCFLVFLSIHLVRFASEPCL
jgi:hypothetical protein